jgi:Sec7-like guanine-nucleotide exchange factor
MEPICKFLTGSKSKTIPGSTPVYIVIYISIAKGLCALITHIDYFFLALFDDFKLIISICHCLCPSFYPYLSIR